MEMRKINKILVLTLSNIGDVILTTPVIETLKEDFPQANLDVLVGLRGKEVLAKDKGIRNLIVYDKHSRIKEKLSLIKKLRQEQYDLVVDLRRTVIPLLIRPRCRTPLLRKSKKDNLHMRDKHLRSIEMFRAPEHQSTRAPVVYFDKADEQYIDNLLGKEGIEAKDILVVVAPGALSSSKRWPKEYFIEVCRRIKDEFKAKIILAGDRNDYDLCAELEKETGVGIYNFANKTTIPQLKFLLERAKILITNDSAVLHCGSAANIPTIAIFGPTDPVEYGPLADNSIVLRRLLACVPCEEAQCRYGHWNCLKLVKPSQVIEAVKMVAAANRSPLTAHRDDYKRILVIRTDRIGDVVLSTPVIKNLRDNFPQSFIAMMVSPYTKDIVEGNPYLDEVIVYDKDKKHRSVFSTLGFSWALRKYKFDLAIILHPTNRVHIISWLVGIPRRLGYDKKMGFLNTDRIEDKKYLGDKHELEYNLDLLRHLGIEPKDKTLFVPLYKEAEDKIDLFLQRQGIQNNDLIIIHPGASCPSKIWPSQNFAQVCDVLIERYKSKILIVTDNKDAGLGEKVAEQMKNKPTLASGEFSLPELSVVLKRAQLFISNDSGPVHIAVAVGTPVISIFGRKQPGLGPKRWGPLGENDIVLHKDAGCTECLAHNCKIEFKCLQAITPEEVLEATERISVFKDR
jgi:lipopolysaccharide heptosyltransferase II